MKFVFATYFTFRDYDKPQAWLDRIKAYTGILEALAIANQVISIEQINYEGTLLKNGVNYHFKRFGKGKVNSAFRLNLYIKQQAPDVVFIQSLHFPLQVLLLRLMIGNKPRIIIQNHAEKPFSGIKKRLVKLADKFINAYLFASKPMGMEWIEAGNLNRPDKVHEVMELSSVFYPVDKLEARAKTNVAKGKVFLWVGRLDQNKNPLTVIKAFLKFAATQTDASLYMIYHTEELLLQVKEMLKDHPQANAIKLIGKVPNPDMLYWYNSAHFIVSGSHYEGSGTAVCEAMSCGCVPIVTDIFSFRMITNEGRVGALYPAGDEEALLNTLHQTKQMDVVAQRAKALAYFQSNLSFSAIARRIHEIALAN